MPSHPVTTAAIAHGPPYYQPSKIKIKLGTKVSKDRISLKELFLFLLAYLSTKDLVTAAQMSVSLQSFGKFHEIS